VSETSTGSVQARDSDRGNPLRATLPYNDPYGEHGTGPLPGRPGDRLPAGPDSPADGAPAADTGAMPRAETGADAMPIEAAAFARQGPLMARSTQAGRPPAESGLEPLPPQGGATPAQQGGYGTQPRLSSPAPVTTGSSALPPAAPPVLATPIGAAGMPAAAPSVLPASVTAPAAAAQAGMGAVPQRPPAEVYRGARAGTGGPAAAYGRPPADAYGQAAMAPAPDDEITVLTAPVSVAAQAAAQLTAAGAPPVAVVKGRVQIEDEVVEKVAGLAAVEVAGVADLGGNVARALEAVRDHIGAGHRRGTQGVRARIEDRQVAIHVVIVIEYGAVVMEVARAVKANVARAVSHMLGLRVVEVNVTVDDVAMPRARTGAHAADDAGGEQAPDPSL
jgi:uncharacterized alkaline shock family protein YloU